MEAEYIAAVVRAVRKVRPKMTWVEGVGQPSIWWIGNDDLSTLDDALRALDRHDTMSGESGAAGLDSVDGAPSHERSAPLSPSRRRQIDALLSSNDAMHREILRLGDLLESTGHCRVCGRELKREYPAGPLVRDEHLLHLHGPTVHPGEHCTGMCVP